MRILIALAIVVLAGTAVVAKRRLDEARLGFEEDDAGKPPEDFHFVVRGNGKGGKWRVEKVGDAPEGKQVVSQKDGSKSAADRELVALLDDPILSRFDLSVDCKPVSGKLARGCGLVFRWQDESRSGCGRTAMR
jgi:hypothetical protein